MLILLSIYLLIKIINADIILVLGSSNREIQNERLSALFNYLEINNHSIKLYLSGGKKNPTSYISEADFMYKEIIKVYPNIEIYIDRTATNTAENFVNFSKWLYNNPTDKVIINTSDFHKNRAQHMVNSIFKNIDTQWNLSHSKCKWCWDAELVHLKNINNDINNALHI
tara:strand:+ start:1074 stop:1580 length:507 start_codon:yes stop_codon:yes gene_type:complete